MNNYLGNIGRILSAYKSRINTPPTSNVNRLKSFSENDFLSGNPVIIETNEKLENLEKLQYVLNEMTITVRTGQYHDPKEYAFNRKTKTIQSSDYLKNITSSLDYAGNIPICWPQYDKLINWNVPLSRDFLESPRVWCGPGGSITPLHKDGPDNFAIHILGIKRWILFPATDYTKLDMFSPKPEEFPDLHVSTFDLRKYISVQTINDSLGTKCLECELHPGEILFVPAGWGHYVQTITTSVMINIWTNPSQIEPGILR